MKLLDFLRLVRLKKLYQAPPKHRLPQGTLEPNPRHLTRHLKEWPNFFKDVRNHFTPYAKDDYPGLDTFPCPQEWSKMMARKQVVTGEGRTYDYLREGLYNPCEVILRRVFGITGILGPGRVMDIGSPGVVLISGENMKHAFASHARFIMEQKTPWAVPVTAETDIINHYNENCTDKPDSIVKAIHQLYGYMSFNYLRYGALTNGDALLIFRRTPDHGSLLGGQLECSPPIPWNGVGFKSPLAALAYVTHLAHDARDEPRPATLDLTLDDDEKLNSCLPGLEATNITTTKGLSFRLTDRLGAQIGTKVFRGQVIKDQKAIADVIIKIYSLKLEESRKGVEQETKIYEQLSDLQGTSVPRLYATGTVWGLLSVLVLEDCGDQPCDQGGWNPERQDLAKQALTAIHQKGVCHNDIAMQNITCKVDESGRSSLRIIDFQYATTGQDQKIFDQDMKSLEMLKAERVSES